MIATGRRDCLTKMIRQRQKTIIAQSASPVSSGIHLRCLEESPKGISTMIPINETKIFLRIGIEV